MILVPRRPPLPLPGEEHRGQAAPASARGALSEETCHFARQARREGGLNGSQPSEGESAGWAHTLTSPPPGEGRVSRWPDNPGAEPAAT